MKKVTILIAILSIAFSTSLKAQDDYPRGKEKIRAAKVGLITNRLNLSEEQAKTFWIVYDEYDKKRAEIRKSVRQMTAESRNITASDDKILADIKEDTSIVSCPKEYFKSILALRIVP